MVEHVDQRGSWWLRIAPWVLGTGFLLVAARVAHLQVSPNPRLAEFSGRITSSRAETARRGDLLDRHGRLLATSCRGWRLFADPGMLAEPDTVALDLAHLLGESDEDIDRLAVEIDRTILAAPAGRRYVVLLDLLEDWQVDAIRHQGLPGIGLESRLVRHHPGGLVAAGLVGTVGFEHAGLGGAEHALESRLAGSQGRLSWLRDVEYRALWIEPGEYRPARDGEDVRLSIDLVVQRMAEERLAEEVEQRNAAGGRVVVMDPRSGEILALADVLRTRPERDEPPADPIRDRHPRLARNRCVTDCYEPGSTFKPFVWASATELGLADPDETLPTPSSTGLRTAGGRLIRDAHYYGPSTWTEVLVRSLNTGMAIVAERMTPDQMQAALARFGFGRPTGCGLAGEIPGLVTPPGDWTSYTQSSVAMGHEIAVTPVQMVRAFSAFARDGTLPSPRITLRRDDDRPWEIVHRAIEPATARLVRTTMRRVMTEGTGRRAQSSRYRLFGKSGTAQLPRRDGGGYHEDRYVASFIAGAPLDSPRLVVLCVIEDPDPSKGAYYGGRVAGPVVRDVMDDVLAYLGVAPDAMEQVAATPGE